jgi:hypothetical protein
MVGVTTPEPAEAPDGADRADPTFEELPVDSALDFLVNAARVSPVLRAKVQIVEDEIERLRAEVAFLERLVMNVAVRCVRDPEVAEDMVADEREQMRS